MYDNDYGMCCGEEEARQCARDNSFLQKLEREKLKSKQLLSFAWMATASCVTLFVLLVLK